MKKSTIILEKVAGALLIGLITIFACLIWAVIVSTLMGESVFLSMLGGFIIGIAASCVYEKLKDK